ncbi:Biopolymer transport protein ExbD/TolR [Rhodopirellula sallentina SM41]|uniref:Biopolymer transport protein ExbD/TolR n=2 Tax=Rhodopirellula TaxID=265488 RepID=M5U868_9BACT|nr:Biopolymer transport protein ExbD/TolR [Rhodopirellula sallentina SM41]
MTPMIDIVFLLIIFFLVSSHLSRQETRHPVTLAEASSGEPPEADASPITLTLDADSQLFFGGDPITLDQVSSRIRTWTTGRDADAASESNKVRFRIDRVVPYATVEAVLRQLADVGIRDVAIVVNPRRTQGPLSGATAQ